MALARKGTNIALHYHASQREAGETVKEIASLGVECRLFRADLSKTEEALSLAAEMISRFKSVDVLVNNASAFHKTPIEEVLDSDWDALLQINLKAPFLLCQKLGQAMRENEGGKIINIADWSGFRPYKDYLPYCVSKGGLITLTKALARDLAPKVQANAVAPGPVLLPPDFPEEEKEKIIRKTVLGRLGSPLDVAHAVTFLAENDYVNGTVLVVDGGRSLV